MMVDAVGPNQRIQALTSHPVWGSSRSNPSRNRDGTYRTLGECAPCAQHLSLADSSRPERPEPLPICEEPHNAVPTSHRWGHRHQRARLRPGFSIAERTRAGRFQPCLPGCRSCEHGSWKCLWTQQGRVGRFHLCLRGCRGCEHGSCQCLCTQQCKMSTDVAGVLAHGGAIARSRNYEADRGADR